MAAQPHIPVLAIPSFPRILRRIHPPWFNFYSEISELIPVATYYQIIDLQTGTFSTGTLDEAAEISSLDPHDIEWAIEEHGLCETDTFQITKLNDPPEDGHSEPEGDGGEAGDGEIKPHRRGCACCVSQDHMDESGKVIGRTIYCFS
jgi:hypothetical protein